MTAADAEVGTLYTTPGGYLVTFLGLAQVPSLHLLQREDTGHVVRCGGGQELTPVTGTANNEQETTDDGLEW